MTQPIIRDKWQKVYVDRLYSEFDDEDVIRIHAVPHDVHQDDGMTVEIDAKDLPKLIAELQDLL